MNVILINSLAVRIKAKMMTIEQVPPVFREAVAKRLEELDSSEQEKLDERNAE